MKTTIFITFLFFASLSLAGASVKVAINKCSQEYHKRDCLGI